VRSIPLPILLLGALVVARLALAQWWLIADDGVVDTESGRHLQFAWNHHAAIANGDSFSLLGSPTEYPPLLHLAGVIGAAVAGLDVESFIGAQSLLFIPALAIGATERGAWRTGGPRACSRPFSPSARRWRCPSSTCT
jgi:hypothetical protein